MCITVAVEGQQNEASLLRTLSRERSLSCHSCCDTGSRFLRYHPKKRPIQSPHTILKRAWRSYFNLDPHGFHSVSSYDTQRDAEVLFLPGHEVKLTARVCYGHNMVI
jgi:hypothetical protein